MGDLMLCGVLRMPMPHDPSNLGLIEWMQIKQRMAQAAQELEQRAARITALEAQVRAADALADAHLVIVETTEGLPGTVIQECRQISRKALAAYCAAKEGGA